MANLKVNQKEWDALSQQEQQNILDGLKKAGTLNENDTINGDASAPSYGAKGWDPIGDICRAACDVAATAGAAWCTANTGGAALVVCLAAAEAARQECRGRC